MSTPLTNPDENRTRGIPERSWVPTKKWFATLVAGLGTIATTFVANDLDWSDAQTTGVLTLAVALVGAYLKTNDPTPLGVPAA